jgi:Flp pilus assembly protein TadD
MRLYPFLPMLTLTLMGCSMMASREDGSILDWARESAEERAERINVRSVKYLAKGRVDKAEFHLQKALAIDPNSAEVHNNLGNLLFSRHELYQAAWEFERASSLAPNSSFPLINLGMVFEVAGQLERAAEYNRQALEIEPNNAIALGNLARTTIKMDGDPFEITSMLKHLILIDSRPDWIEWAEDMLETRYAILRQSVMSSGETTDECTSPGQPAMTSGLNEPQLNEPSTSPVQNQDEPKFGSEVLPLSSLIHDQEPQQLQDLIHQGFGSNQIPSPTANGITGHQGASLFAPSMELPAPKENRP